MREEFTPKLFTLLKQGIGRQQIYKDVISGVIVGIVALPLAIAFAIASGVSPEKGLITAIIAGLVISVFGGSRVQIGGRTGAFIVIVFGIVAEYGYEGLVISTFLAGFIIIAMGMLKVGNYLKFFPYPLIVGFTSGIAIIIFSSQMNEFFGWNISNLPADFIDKWKSYGEHVDATNFIALGIALGTVLLTKYFHHITPKVPGSIIAILASAILVKLLDLPVSTIESKFGEIPNTLHLPTIPSIHFDTVKALIRPAFAIALLGAIESLLSAVVADGMIGGKHRPNMELIAQGGANVLSALFGGIPATGAIARTATNVKNGGRTPIAGLVHAITLLFIMMVFGAYAKLIPMSCLAGILVVVAYNMSEWRQFTSILKSGSLDVAVLLTTFFLTVVFDLVIAIEVGIVLSSVLFMKRMSDSLLIQNMNGAEEKEEKLFENELTYDRKRIMLYEINGPLFFGAAQQLQDVLMNINSNPKCIIIRMRYVPFIDATGYQRLKEIIHSFEQKGILVAISGVSENLKSDFEKHDLFRSIQEDQVFHNIDDAMNWAKTSLKI